MSYGQRAAIGAGVLALALGLLAAFYPPVAAWFVVDDLFVLLIGVLALLLGVTAVQRRRRTEFTAGEPTTPETKLELPVPGDDADDEIDRLRGRHRWTVRQRNETRERIAEAAVGVIRRRERCSREEAIEQLERGEWTDDRIAASFLGDVRPPVRIRLRALFSSEPRFKRRARRTIDAIHRLAEVSDDGGS